MGPLCLFVLALAAPLEVQTRTVLKTAGGEPLKVPFVAGAGAAIERINVVLFMTLLSTAPPVGERTEEGDAKWYKTLGFTVARNDDRLLELGIAGETCGVTCEANHRTLTFDVSTGRSIDLHDVFAPAGLEIISARMRAERVRHYRDQVRRLARFKDDRFSAQGNKLTFNEGCLKIETKHETRIESLAAAFATKSVVITAESCSSQATRSYDDVGEVSLTFPYDDAKLPMTPYGKALLLGRNDATPPTSPFGQALRGTIGPAAITAVLERPNHDGSFNGHYFYDKRRTSIPFRGHVERDGTIQLVQSASMRFALTPVGASLTGTLLDERRTAVILEAK